MSIEKYEIMQRDTRERLMFDIEALLRLDEGWEPIGGVAVVCYLRNSSNTGGGYWIEHKYIQAVIKQHRRDK